MKTVKRKIKGVVAEYNIYTKEEANNLGIQYKEWRNTGILEYGLTDDGYVCQLLGEWVFKKSPKANAPPAQKNTELKVLIFPFKRILLTKTAKLFYMQKPDWVTGEMRRNRTKLVVKLFAQQLLAGQVDYELLGRIYRPDQKIPAATVKRLLKQEKIQNMVKDEVAKELKGIGVDTKFTLNTIKRAIEIAEIKQDAANMLRGADTLVDLLDMKPDKQTNSIQWTMTSDSMKQLNASVEDAELQLPA